MVNGFWSILFRLGRYAFFLFWQGFIVTLSPLQRKCPHRSWRGAGVVTEQIANLSAGNRRPGSNPGLSANVKSQCECAGFFRCTQNNFNYLCPRLQRSGRGLVRLRRLVWDQEIAGSNPAAPTAKRSVFLAGRFLLTLHPGAQFRSGLCSVRTSGPVPLWDVAVMSEFC